MGDYCITDLGAVPEDLQALILPLRNQRLLLVEYLVALGLCASLAGLSLQREGAFTDQHGLSGTLVVGVWSSELVVGLTLMRVGVRAIGIL